MFVMPDDGRTPEERKRDTDKFIADAAAAGVDVRKVIRDVALDLGAIIITDNGGHRG